MRTFIFTLIVSVSIIGAASAEPFENTTFMPSTVHHDPWRADWLNAATTAPAVLPLRIASDTPAARQANHQPVHIPAVTHSDAQFMRAKIHRAASWAARPLLGSRPG